MAGVDITLIAFPYKQCHHKCEFLKNYHCTNLEPCNPVTECNSCNFGKLEGIGYSCTKLGSDVTASTDTTPTSKMIFECPNWIPKDSCLNCVGHNWCMDKFSDPPICNIFERMPIMMVTYESGVFPNDESSIQYFLYDLTAAVRQLTGKIHVADNLIEGYTHIDYKVAILDNAVDITAMAMKTHYLREHDIDIDTIKPTVSQYRPVHPRYCKKCDGRDIVNISGGYKCKECGNSWDIETKNVKHDECFGLVSELDNRCKFIEETPDGGLFICMISSLAEVDLPECCFGSGSKPLICEHVRKLIKGQKLDSDKEVVFKDCNVCGKISKMLTIEMAKDEENDEFICPVCSKERLLNIDEKQCEICSDPTKKTEKIMTMEGYKWGCAVCKKKIYDEVINTQLHTENCPDCGYKLIETQSVDKQLRYRYCPKCQPWKREFYETLLSDMTTVKREFYKELSTEKKGDKKDD